MKWFDSIQRAYLANGTHPEYIIMPIKVYQELCLETGYEIHSILSMSIVIVKDYDCVVLCKEDRVKGAIRAIISYEASKNQSSHNIRP